MSEITDRLARVFGPGTQPPAEWLPQGKRLEAVECVLIVTLVLDLVVALGICGLLAWASFQILRQNLTILIHTEPTEVGSGFSGD